MRASNTGKFISYDAFDCFPENSSKMCIFDCFSDKQQVAKNDCGKTNFIVLSNMLWLIDCCILWNAIWVVSFFHIHIVCWLPKRIYKNIEGGRNRNRTVLGHWKTRYTCKINVNENIFCGYFQLLHFNHQGVNLYHFKANSILLTKILNVMQFDSRNRKLCKGDIYVLFDLMFKLAAIYFYTLVKALKNHLEAIVNKYSS